MSSTTAPSIAQVQQEFQELIAVVSGPDSHQHTATAIERQLFRRLLALGLTLLRLFFLTRAAVRPPVPVVGPTAHPLPFKDQRRVTYYSVFGKLSFDRHAFTVTGQPVVCPLDAALNLPQRCYSDLLSEWMAFSSTDETYRESQTVLERILGLTLSVATLETTTQEAALDVPAFYAQPPAAPPPASVGTILVAQSDGKGVPLVLPPPAERPVRPAKGAPAGRKREAIVTALYTIAPFPRTPEAVVAALLHDPDPPTPTRRPRPIQKEVRATLDGKEAAISRLAQRAQQREDASLQHRVALTDGAEALQAQMRAQLPTSTLVLDIIHATEYLWAAANARLGEGHPERTAWVRGHLTALLSGQVATVIAALETAAADPTLTVVQQKAILGTVGYYRRNTPFMHYDVYLAAGWPIGTGVVDGACGHLVKDRMEQAGMRWTKPSAQAVLDLRAVRLNADWEAYWAFHQQRQHERLYGATALLPARAELQALTLEVAA